MKASSCFLFLLLWIAPAVHAQTGIEIKTIAPGVIKMTVGTPDQFSPYSFCTEKPRVEELKQLNAKDLPFSLKDVKVEINGRGVQVRVPLANDEQLYGFGMQIGSFEQRGLKKKPIVNDNPVSTIGFT